MLKQLKTWGPITPCVAWREFCRAEQGSMTVFLGLASLAVFLAAGIAIDYGRLVMTQTALAAAVDAAALQAGSSAMAGESALEDLARDVVDSNYDAEKYGPIVEFDLTQTASTVTLTAKVMYKTTFMQLAGIDTIGLPVLSEVTRSGNNIEVALVLDSTGSMRGHKINALISAAKDFVDAVVWEDQGQFYSKLAVVPYSMGVNLGSRAEEARGSVSTGTCSTPGCQSYRFRNARGNNRSFSLSTCVSERTGSEAYLDVPPGVAPVGRNYASPDNRCLDSELLPLSTDKEAIKDAIDALDATGSTAGQIGIAWGWYVLSKDFGMWSGDSEPADYGTAHVSKVAVIMTDGEFNTSHCNGVVARSSGNGSGPRDDKIDCDATNGSSTSQALALCQAMKGKNIAIFTIGFDIEDDEAAQEVMEDCASGADHAFLAATDEELGAVFQAIGKRVSALRISK